MTKSVETDIKRFLNEDFISCGCVRIADESVDLVITDIPVESRGIGLTAIISATKNLSSIDMSKFLSLN